MPLFLFKKKTKTQTNNRIEDEHVFLHINCYFWNNYLCTRKYFNSYMVTTHTKINSTTDGRILIIYKKFKQSRLHSTLVHTAHLVCNRCILDHYIFIFNNLILVTYFWPRALPRGPKSLFLYFLLIHTIYFL